MFSFLGDSGYPLLPFLMTPKLNQPPKDLQERYIQMLMLERDAL